MCGLERNSGTRQLRAEFLSAGMEHDNKMDEKTINQKDRKIEDVWETNYGDSDSY